MQQFRETIREAINEHMNAVGPKQAEFILQDEAQRIRELHENEEARGESS